MSSRIKRYYGCGHLHFITFSCYQRRPLLEMPNARDFFVGSLGTIRTRYKFKLVGYVVMPEHVHLLVSEPTSGNLSVVLKALKHRVSCDLRGTAQHRELPPCHSRFETSEQVSRDSGSHAFTISMCTRKKKDGKNSNTCMRIP